MEGRTKKSNAIDGLGGGFKYFYLHPYLGKWSKLTHIFFKWVETTAYCSDLTKTFDTVNRELLLEDMQCLNAPLEIISLVHRLYECTHFHVSHRGQYRKIKTTQGIRQGCKAAPTLWTIYITYVLQYYGHLTDPNWVRQCVTVYADDWCIHDSFICWEDAEIILARLGILMDLLERCGLAHRIHLWYIHLHLP